VKAVHLVANHLLPAEPEACHQAIEQEAEPKYEGYCFDC
jgi:hypothetical protein